MSNTFKAERNSDAHTIQHLVRTYLGTQVKTDRRFNDITWTDTGIHSDVILHSFMMGAQAALNHARLPHTKKCIRIRSAELTPLVQAAISDLDHEAIFDTERNPVTLWVTTVLTPSELQLIDGVADAIVASVG